METTLRVRKSTRNKLSAIKDNSGFENIDEVIDHLLSLTRPLNNIMANWVREIVPIGQRQDPKTTMWIDSDLDIIVHLYVREKGVFKLKGDNEGKYLYLRYMDDIYGRTINLCTTTFNDEGWGKVKSAMLSHLLFPE